MSTSEEDLLAVIDAFYQAALEPPGWEDALQQLSSAMGGLGAVILPLTRPEDCISSTSLLDANFAYRQYWSAHDSRRHAGLKLGFKSGVFTDLDVFTPEMMARDPFYQEFLRRFDIEHCASFLLTPTPDTVVSLSTERQFGKGAFEPEQLRFLSKVGPHAARALALAKRLSSSNFQTDSDPLAFIHRLDCAAVIVSHKGEVVAMNSSARGLDGDGLKILRNGLVSSNCMFQTAVDRLLQAAFERSSDQVCSVTLPRPSGKCPLILRAIPLSKHDFPVHLAQKPGFVLVLISDPEKKAHTSASALRSLGLTPAESAVAMLVGSGLSPKAASDQLNISVGTVRTHLRNIYLKLDIKRQAELVQFVTRLQT